MPEPLDLGRMIAYCGHLGKLCHDKHLRQSGYDVTPVQSHTLGYLACCGREVNQRELEQELRLKPSTVNGIVTRLEEKGYIARRASPADGRCRLVSLTESGRSKVGEFCAALKETDRLFTSVLSREEQELLRTLLARMIQNLESEVKEA